MTALHRTAIFKAQGVLAREIVSLLEDTEGDPLGRLILVDNARDFVRFKGARLDVAPRSAERLGDARVGLLGGADAGLIEVNVASDDAPGVVTDPLAGPLPAHRGSLLVPRAGALLVARVARALSARRAVGTVLEPAGELGAKALTELYEQTTALFGQRVIPTEIFGARLSFNVLPGRGSARGAAEVAGCPVALTHLLVPVMAGTTASVELELPAALPREELVDALEDAGVEVHEAVDPASVVGESAMRCTLVAVEGARVRLILVADEARLLGEALIAAAVALHAAAPA